jgi:hypothetical protein
MVDLNTQLEPAAVLTRPNWGAIWAGVFTFLAIWSVFGALCLAIFASSASLSIAMSVWGIILTIIAMFVAGRTTGQLAGITNSREGVMQGMIMFGLAVTSTLFIVVIGATAFGNTQVTGTAHGSLLGIFSDFGWALFVGLFLGWLAAMAGASSAHKDLPHPALQHQVRHA